MDNLNYCVRHGYGKFNFLDKAYNKFVNESINDNNEESRDRWEVYNSIMIDLLNLGKRNYFDEVKYRLTGGENPNKVMLDIIGRDFETSSTLSNYKSTIKHFRDCDILKRFMNK